MGRLPKDPGTTRDTRSSNVEKSHPLHNFLYQESLPGPGKRIRVPLYACPCPAHSHLGQRKLAGSHRNLCVWGVSEERRVAGGKRGVDCEASRQRLRLHKGSSVCPHTDINKMCIYLFIYTRGLGQRLGPALSLKGQGTAQSAAVVKT